jgi:hypothetical protein
MHHTVEHATLVAYIHHFHLTQVFSIARYLLEFALRNRRRSKSGDNQESASIESLAGQGFQGEVRVRLVKGYQTLAGWITQRVILLLPTRFSERAKK